MLRSRTALFAVGVAALLVGSQSASAQDCIRVSSSVTGMKASERSGHWFTIDVSTRASVQETFAALGDPLPTDEQADCFVAVYAATGNPDHFAIGQGVAGPRGVLTWRNTTTVGDGRGIDHLEASSIVASYLDAIEACDIPVTGE